MKVNFEKIKQQNLLTTEGEKVWLQPDSLPHNFTTYPLPEDKQGCILVDFDEYIGLMAGFLMFSDDLKNVVEFEDDGVIIEE